MEVFSKSKETSLNRWFLAFLHSILSNIFLYDYQIKGKAQLRSPQRREFLRQLLPQLDSLKDVQLDKGDGMGSVDQAKASSREGVKQSGGDEPMELDETGVEDEEKRAIRLCKTGQLLGDFGGWGVGWLVGLFGCS